MRSPVAAERPVEAAGELVSPELARGEHVELQLELAALLQHPGAAVDLAARLVVLDQRLAARAEVDAVDLAVDAAAGERQRPLLGVLEAEGGLGMGGGEGGRRGGLVGEEGQDQALDATERSGGVRELAAAGARRPSRRSARGRALRQSPRVSGVGRPPGAGGSS